MKKIPVILFVLIMPLVLAACGGSSGSSSAAATASSTRVLTGVVGSSAAAMASPAKAASACSGVVQVVATATDGTTVTDDALDGCVMRLELVVGKSYVISFVDAAGGFLATLVGANGSIFSIVSGSVEIDLETISIAGGQATFTGNILNFLDSDGDGTVDAADDAPCGGSSCDDVYSCAHFGFADADGDDICDAWESGVPGADDMAGGSGGSGGDDGAGGDDGGSSGGSGSGAVAMIADHSVIAGFGDIPQDSISQAVTNLKIFYGHTSHGSQLVTGMQMLQDANHNWSGMTVHEEGTDLGNPDRTTWAATTRTWLNAHPDTNVVIWSWCGQVSSSSSSDISTYLSLMEALEADYPDVQFVYMTGHTDGSGASGTLRTRNKQIRDYCTANDKILFDFEDVESWDPAGTYYPDISDDCSWCTTWCSSHSCSACGSCAHSHCFNCYQKGQAFWWLLARMAGWDGQ